MIIARLKNEAASAELEKQQLMDRLTALEKLVSPAASAAEPPKTAEKKTCSSPAAMHSLRITYGKDDLVTLERELKKKEQALLAIIIANNQTWIERALLPITFKQLLTGAAPEAEALALLKAMLGTVIWEKFFNTEGDAIGAADHVPAQIASIIQAVTVKLKKEVADQVTSFKKNTAATFDEAEAVDMQHRLDRSGAYRAY